MFSEVFKVEISKPHLLQRVPFCILNLKPLNYYLYNSLTNIFCFFFFSLSKPTQQLQNASFTDVKFAVKASVNATIWKSTLAPIPVIFHSNVKFAKRNCTPNHHYRPICKSINVFRRRHRPRRPLNRQPPVPQPVVIPVRAVAPTVHTIPPHQPLSRWNHNRHHHRL